MTVRNFRGFSQGVVDFPGHTLLVGGNNAGKSTICEALDLVLGPERLYRRPVVDEHDFFCGKYLAGDGSPVEIRIDVVLVGLSAELERRFNGHLRRWSEATGKFVDEDAGIEGADDWGAAWALPLRFIGRYDRAEDDFVGNTFFAHPEPVGEDVDEDVEIALGGGLRIFGREHKRLCGFVFLRTHRTGARALSLQRGSLLDTVLRLSGDGVSEMWLDTLEKLRSLQPGIGDIAQLKMIRQQIETRMAHFVPLATKGDATAFFASDLTRENLREVVRLFIAAQPTDHIAPFQKLGAGSVNLLVFALLTFIADLKKKKSVIFAMEEPEIALPPHTQRRVTRFVLSEMGQAIVTSHSPSVIEQFEPRQIVIVAREPGSGVVAAPIDTSEVKPKWFKTQRRQFAEAVLARGVLVVEGATEAGVFAASSAVMESALGAEAYWDLDLAGVTVFNAGSDGAVPKYGPIFKSLGKSAYAFFDKSNKSLSEQAVADLKAYTQFWESPQKGMEGLLATEMPLEVLRTFLNDAVAWLDYPKDCGEVGEGMTEGQVRGLAMKVLKARKGDAYGYAARLVESATLEQLPATIRGVLNTINDALGPPLQALCAGQAKPVDPPGRPE
jgi:putative ATP-dependent endonuclease of OLD family